MQVFHHQKWMVRPKQTRVSTSQGPWARPRQGDAAMGPHGERAEGGLSAGGAAWAGVLTPLSSSPSLPTPTGPTQTRNLQGHTGGREGGSVKSSTTFRLVRLQTHGAWLAFSCPHRSLSAYLGSWPPPQITPLLKGLLARDLSLATATPLSEIHRAAWAHSPAGM